MVLSYVLLCSCSLHLTLTGVDGAVIWHKWTSVFLLMSQRTRNLSRQTRNSRKKNFKNDQSNTNSPLDVVFSWMRGIHLWDSRAGGWGPNKLPAPPGPSAPQTTREQWQDQLLDFWAAHAHFRHNCVVQVVVHLIQTAGTTSSNHCQEHINVFAGFKWYLYASFKMFTGFRSYTEWKQACN